jgi:hypothetical protein
MQEYGRQYVLRIGKDDDALVINNLRIMFKLKHTSDKKANSATITVYNLSQDTVNNMLKGVADRYHQISLSTGYGDLNDVRQIYAGQITKAVTSKGSGDAVVDSTLVLTCDDGGTAARNAMMSATFVAGSCHSDILKVCATTMTGVQPGLLGIASDVVLSRGRVCYGMTRHILSQIASHHDADWSIQHGCLTLMARDYVCPGEAIVLNQQTGMINAPRVTDAGLEVTCLLRPEIVIGTLVRVDSINDYYDGDYKVVSIASDGDTHDNLWQNTLTLTNGKFKPASKLKTAGGKA